MRSRKTDMEKKGENILQTPFKARIKDFLYHKEIARGVGEKVCQKKKKKKRISRRGEPVLRGEVFLIPER